MVRQQVIVLMWSRISVCDRLVIDLANCSVTFGGNDATVTLNSNSEGVFECSLDGGSFEQCK